MSRGRARLAAAAPLVAALAGWLPGAARAELRWVSSDPHVHTTAWGCARAVTPEQLLSQMAANGFDIAASLVWGAGLERDRGWFTGGDHELSTRSRILHYDLELSQFAADRGGHLILLGLRELAFSPDLATTPLSGVPVVDWALAQDERVTVGAAHGFKWPADGSFPEYDTWGRPLEFPVHVARGRAHFLSTEHTGEGSPVDDGTWLLWTRLLDSGFRVALAGGSDRPCIHGSFGGDAPRTRVLIEEPLSYEAWLEGIRRGRSVVAIGGAGLDLRVGDARIGDELDAQRGQPLAVRIDAALESAGSVELLVDGEAAWSAALGAGAAALETELRLERSAWLTARAPAAQTSPIYVVVGGAPIRGAPEVPCYFVRYLDFLAAHVRDEGIPMGESTEAALEAYAQARAVFEERFREAGGTLCH